MKIAALIIGILGSLAILGLGAKWVSDYNKYEKSIAAIEKMSTELGGSEEIAASMSQVKKLHTAGMLMVVMGFLALIASVLVFKMAKLSGIVMLAAVVIPAIFAPKSLVFSFLLIIAGVMALLAKPKVA